MLVGSDRVEDNGFVERPTEDLRASGNRFIPGLRLKMDLHDAIATLRRHEDALRARGIRHAAVFGSVARSNNRPDGDLDILVEFEPEAEGSVYEYVRLKDYIAGLFDGPVDVIDRDALKPHLRAPSARDVVRAF
jgi:uncharacterized protein